MLAVIGAMRQETDLIRAAMTVAATQIHAGIETVRGDFRGSDIVLAQCGIGKVNATICTQMLIDRFQPDALVFSGVAGGLLPDMRVGDAIIASHLIQYDMDLTAFDEAFPAEPAGPSLMLGTVVSGDRFIQDPQTLRWLQREFSALATEMEGAAVGYTCGVNGVPFVIIRALSDSASESASSDFASNLDKVCENSFRLLDCLVPKIGAGGKAASPEIQKAS